MITYNSQRNNFSFAGKFPAWAQCFSSCAWMLLSHYASKYKGDDDEGLARYVDEISNVVGARGIGERVAQKYKYVTGNTALWWITHKHAIEEYLWRAGIKAEASFSEAETINTIHTMCTAKPVIIGTKKMGGLPAGHIILGIGATADALICHDPYGDARTNYKNTNGEAVAYPLSYLTEYTGERITCLHIQLQQ